jgi:hypothetical protein
MKMKMKIGEQAAVEWWDSLTIDEKVKFKKGFELFRNSEEAMSYPNMYDLTNIRISKLSRKQITRIWVFQDKC